MWTSSSLPGIRENPWPVFLGDNTPLKQEEMSRHYSEYQTTPKDSGRTVLCPVHPSTMSLAMEDAIKCKHHMSRPIYGTSEQEQRQRRQDEDRSKREWAEGGCWIPYREHALNRPENEQGECLLCEADDIVPDLLPVEDDIVPDLLETKEIAK